jgi:hypothetical protein
MQVVRSDSQGFYWYGNFSRCLNGGSIETDLIKFVSERDPNVIILFPRSDGFVKTIEVGSESTLDETKLNEIKSSVPEGSKYILAGLCTRNFNDPRLILLPLDDEAYVKGVHFSLTSRTFLPPWEDRNPIAFWRGGVSGGTYPTIRTRLVELMCDYPYSDFKFVPTSESYLRTGPMDMNDKRMFDEDRFINYQVNFKYILILDGACIASAHQWVFASGSVPIIVSHPDNNYWFKKYLKPMVHYVPIEYDLSDLKEKIEWLRSNDDKAKQIAKNATEFAIIVLSPHFQRGYLYEEVMKLIQ